MMRIYYLMGAVPPDKRYRSILRTSILRTEP